MVVSNPPEHTFGTRRAFNFHLPAISEILHFTAFHSE